MVERAILESNLCRTEWPSPPVEKYGLYLLSLSLFHESEKFLSYSLFGDLLGTVDNCWYRRRVRGVLPREF